MKSMILAANSALALAVVLATVPAHAGNPASMTASPTFDKPRLVLQITVDQFRGDLPTRYADRLGEGGLRYLLRLGITASDRYLPAR